MMTTQPVRLSIGLISSQYFDAECYSTHAIVVIMFVIEGFNHEIVLSIVEVILIHSLISHSILKHIINWYF